SPPTRPDPAAWQESPRAIALLWILGRESVRCRQNARVDLLERFDEQVRRSGADEHGMFVGEGWSAVLALPPDVDAAVERLRSLPGEREWKLFGHDPAWLPHRLRELGLEPGAEESV